MEQEKIDILYKILIDTQLLSTTNLHRYGLSEEDINLMIEQKIIEPTSPNQFKLTSMEKFRQYGVKLVLVNNITEANRCFAMCYAEDPYARRIALQYLLSKIIKKNYEEAFEIFSKIELQHGAKYEKDNKLYLYLLGIVSDAPEEYKSRIKELTPRDIILKFQPITRVENEIRVAIAKHKFKYAYQLINSRYLKEKNYSLKFELLRILVIQAIEVEKELKEKLFTLTKQNNYNEIIQILTTIKEKRHLSELEESILHIAKNIINLNNCQICPVSKNIVTMDMYESIQNNDYEQALEINKEFLEHTHQDGSKNTIYLLLTTITKLIQTYNEEQSKKSIQPTIDIDEEIKPTTQNQESEDLNDIEELAYYIKETKMSFTIARKTLGIIPEQLLLIKLIYARDYYIEGNYYMGDTFLKEVEQSNNLTKRVTDLLQHIKLNKYTYNNDLEKNSKKLVLTP